MTAIIDIILTKQLVKSLSVAGIVFSVDSTSLLNRFMIRPEGVDSKKLSLLRNIENNIESCKYFTALTNINVCVISFESENKPKI
jgi:hypothetical protein